MSPARRVVTLLAVLAISTACGTNSTPTAPTGPAPPTASVAPPRPALPPPAEFPPVSGPARVYSDAQQPLYAPYSSRYVLYDNGTFEFQMNHPSGTGGTYETTGNVIIFRWSGDDRWHSSGELTADTLMVRYNVQMQWTDFLDGVYTRH